MKLIRFFDRGAEALPLLRHDVKDHWLVQRLEEFKSPRQQGDVMTVDRAEITQAEILEDHAGSDDLLHSRLDLVSKLTGALAADPFDKLCSLVVEVSIGRTGGNPVEMLRDGAGIPGNRPLIIIEHDDKAFCGLRDIVEGLVADSTGEGSIAGNGHDMLGATIHIPRCRHAECRGEGRPCMTCSIAVVLALGSKQESVQSSVLTHRSELLPASSQDLVNVTLMADVEEDLVGGSLEDAVQGDREFDDAEIRSKVASCFGKRTDQVFPDLLGK